jgi:hypothetical protein
MKLPALLLLVVVLGCGNIEKPASNVPPITVSANQLIEAYKANELAADDKYKGKPLIVSGRLSDISETLGSLQADLAGNNDLEFINVKCSFNDDQRQSLSALKKGSTVTFSGTGDGMTAGLYVGLTNCKVN